MAHPWIAPIDWAEGQPLTATDLNKLSTMFRYLYDRPSVVATVRGSGSDITTASTTNVAVDDGQFALTLVTTGSALRIELDCHVAHSVAANFIAFDVLIDDTNYASSMTGTPATQGLWSPRIPTAAGIYPFSGAHVLTLGQLTPAGSHTFKLRWRTQAATATLKLGSGYLFQFRIREI